MGHTAGQDEEESSGARSLMLNLLSSPDNLQFALQHQADKVQSIKKQLETLLPPCAAALTTPLSEARSEMEDKPPDPAARLMTPAVTSTQIPLTSSPQHLSSQTSTSSLSSLMTSQNSLMTSSTPYSRVRRKWQRNKSRAKQPYIQLPPSFKYPEPIDVCPTRASRQQARQRKKQGSATSKSQQVPQSTHVTPPTRIINSNPCSGGVVGGGSQTLQFCYQPPPLGRGGGGGGGVMKPPGNVPATAVQPDTVNLQPSNPLFPNATSASLVPTTIPGTLPTVQPPDTASKLLLSIPPQTVSQIVSTSQLLTDTTGKPMLEIVVGELPELNPKFLATTDQALWNTAPDEEKHTTVQQPSSWPLFQNPWPQHNSPASTSPLLQWRTAVDYTKSRRIRTKIEPSMLHLLESKYSESHFVSPAERRQLADSLGITERAVIYWYQNRRRKDIKNLNNKESP